MGAGKVKPYKHRAGKACCLIPTLMKISGQKDGRQRPLRIPGKDCIACRGREGVTSNGTCSLDRHDRMYVAQWAQRLPPPTPDAPKSRVRVEPCQRLLEGQMGAGKVKPYKHRAGKACCLIPTLMKISGQKDGRQRPLRIPRKIACASPAEGEGE